MEYEALRGKMVEEQLVPRGIISEKVLAAFRKVERHKFVPGNLKIDAYNDFPLSIGEGQTISQPYIVALMTECLDLKREQKVLEIGTGSGYQTAILAELVKDVYSIERLETLSENAASALRDAGYVNVSLKVGDGTLGWEEFAPFDRVIITAASPTVPSPLIGQLKENGKLILPLGENYNQILTLIEKKNNNLVTTPVCGCVFVPLVGKYANQGEMGK